MTPKIAGGPIPHTIDETDPDSVAMEAYRNRHTKSPPKVSGIKINPHGHVDAVLLGHVRDILSDRRRCCTILELAEETARRMGGELSPGAKMYPAHPSRLAIVDCCQALADSGEIERILDQKPTETPKPIDGSGERGGAASGRLTFAAPAADPSVSGAIYLWLNGDKGP